MQVSQIMTSKVHSCRRDDTLDDVRERCRKERVSALPVLDESDELAGIVTLTDLLPEWEHATPVKRIMSPFVYTLPPSADAHLAARLMRSKRIHHVVVTEGDAVVGIVSSYDLLQLVASPEGAADVVERGKASPRQVLHAMLENVSRRQAKVDDDLLRTKAPVEQDFAEAAVQLENDEVLQALNQEGHQQLEAISEALEKLDAGTWGLCEDCNQLIPIARLEALPYATTCVECARAREA
ncbi:MAG: CBS domain-containing protein [Planctomycetes bacterium]|nr:CBS domain-containing protein [Planctomycetota bacterium]